MTVSKSTLQSVHKRIIQAANRGGRQPENITLIAVSKRKPLADIVAAYEAGVRHFGENRSEELAEKASALSHLPDIHWHFIGHLQSRQSLAVARYADYFHALDRLKIAERLSAQLVMLHRQLPVFIQINISGEASKNGFDCQHWQTQPEQFSALLAAIQHINTLPNLVIQGLMTMAPFDASADQLHKLFGNMASLSKALHTALPMMKLPWLSMGMSADFEIAIEAGATHVRIGTAIFGERINP